MSTGIWTVGWGLTVRHCKLTGGDVIVGPVDWRLTVVWLLVTYCRVDLRAGFGELTGVDVCVGLVRVGVGVDWWV